MRYFPLFVILTVFALPVAGQNQIVTGQITDDRNVPIVGPTVCQINTTNCERADMNGIFHLMLLPGKEKRLQVECLGFNPVEIIIADTVTHPITITLDPMYIPDDVILGDPANKSSSQFVMRSAIQLEGISVGFDEFATLLGSYNTDKLDDSGITKGIELGAAFSGFYTGFGFGMSFGYDGYHDSLKIDVSHTTFGLNLGYNIVNTRRIRLTPVASLRWFRFRLLNYNDHRKIPLTGYLDERDLDLRFNQTAAFAGLNIDYKIYDYNYIGGDYWSVGLYGGYMFRLNKIPWIYSEGNRLTTDRQIDLENFIFGISVSFFTESR